jgi:glutamate formiminotransferase/formiminotetrahydrofolate cyclodeaminase
VDEVLNEAAEKCQDIKSQLVKAVDEDTQAFNAFMKARRLPKKTEDEKKARRKAMQEGLKKAVSVPLKTAELCFQTIEVAQVVAENGNPNSVTDVGVGAEAAFAGVKGGIYNVLINLKDIKDADYCNQMRKTCEDLEKKSQKALDSVIKVVKSKL